MGARQRLNSLYFYIIVIVSGLIGGATESWLMFWISAGVMAASMLHGGDIRPHSRSRKPFRRRR
ncbi:hypothetical protein Pan153_53600 [Gimesia panareensis]|uniref:Uncharacterized protein n=1 Tax=Gimesia panareensis TaxID=2527978 RepID=A0A518FWC7_9PLAN|nr:hypothetical protein [Gimesia panareensis]QDV20683.1 hypothetical protein Pan153_53600 [Gimesia panareensis]